MADEEKHKSLKKKSRSDEDNAPRNKVRAGANRRKKIKPEREVDKDRLRILLICDYNSAGAPTVIEHINSFYKYSRHEICILSGLIQNQGDLPTLFEKGKPRPFDLDNFDILIIHYSMTLSIDSYISQETKRRIRSFRGLKGLFLQDEYRFVDKTIATIKDLGFSIIFSCIPEDQLEQVYPKALLPGVTVVNVLTGYAPFSLNFFKTKPLKDRKIDVCYRGRKYPYWHGRAGLEKWSIAEAFQKNKRRLGLKVDISYKENRRLYGLDWINFLSNSRAVLGVESGCSVFDFSGKISASSEVYTDLLGGQKKVKYEEVRSKFFETEEDLIDLSQISPRIFEAIATKTLLVLYEGVYSGVIEPWIHYVPVKKDHSNLDEVARIIKDRKHSAEIISRAYADVMLAEKYSYEKFIRDFDKLVSEKISDGNLSKKIFKSADHYKNHYLYYNQFPYHAVLASADSTTSKKIRVWVRQLVIGLRNFILRKS